MLSEYPETLRAHPRVEKSMLIAVKWQRQEIVRWGMAETMAYATLLDEGANVRLSGEDAGRGTFFHRHAVVHNQNDGDLGYVPLTHLHANQGRFEVWDSVLSEEAVLALNMAVPQQIQNPYHLGSAIWGLRKRCTNRD